jgi:mannose-1-phosphate guanylyltransferase / mannose-6-phosphate isomerase
MNCYAIILCGGSGARLWPLSRSLKPKQLLALNGDTSLLQQTAHRVCQKVNPSHLYTVTHEDHRFEVKGQLAELYPEALPNVIAEPVAKNTLPAIAIAVKRIHDQDSSAVIGVFASDHAIDNEPAFIEAWQSAEVAAENGFLALLGILPTEPATGYGYIKPKQSLSLDKASLPVFEVETFVEKPNKDLAERYVAENCLWNSGMFVFRADVFIQMLERFQPELSAQIFALTEKNIHKNYHELPSISMDFGLAEKSDKVAVVPVDMAWSDLGSWESIYQRHQKNAGSNVLRGNIVESDTQNSLLWAETGVIATLGVDNLIVVQTADVTMICERSRTEDVKLIVNQVQARYPSLAETHPTVQRPWGSYTVLEEGEHFKIKSIEVKPGASLSLQMHHHRSEHWVVVSGLAKVINGEREIYINTNESTFIPSGQKHRLANPGKTPCVIIEVQSGTYVGEDDIVRLEDNYGRLV